MGCTPSRVQPEQADTSAPEHAALTSASQPAATTTDIADTTANTATSQQHQPTTESATPENEIQPFRPASSSASQDDAAAVETSAAVFRPMHHSQPSQSLRPSEFSASHTQQSSPRSQAQLSPSSQQQHHLGVGNTMHTPPAASSAPRVSILKAPGEKKKKDWEAIRAAKLAASPHHGKSASATLDGKEMTGVLEEEMKESSSPHHPTIRAIIRTQSSSSNHSQSQRLNRPLSIPTTIVPSTQQQQQSDESTPSMSPSNASQHVTVSEPTTTKPVRLGGSGGSNANSRQNSFRTVGAGTKKKKRRTSHQGMMSKLALQFPAVRASFAAVYTSFQQFCQMTVRSDSTDSAADTGGVVPSAAPAVLPTSMSALGHITDEKFPALLEHLTHHNCTFTAEQVTSLFTLSHIEHSATLTFRECLIAIALGYYLAPQQQQSQQSTTDPNFDKIARGFRVIKSAFEEIDDDNSGMLSAAEMKQALFAASSTNSKSDVLQARFMELDINGDGDVEFKEFLYGVVSWVGMTSEEELDDMEQSV